MTIPTVGAVRRAAAIAVVLVALGNAADALGGGDVLAISWAGGIKAAGTLALVLAAARWTGMSLGELGIRRAGLFRAALIGAGLALLIGGVSLLVLRIGPFVGGRVTYAPLRNEGVAPLLFHALIALPLQTALPEELAFRGALYAALDRLGGTPLAILGSTFIWTAAHALSHPPAFLGAVAAAGLLLALWRWACKDLVGPIIAHVIADLAL